MSLSLKHNLFTQNLQLRGRGGSDFQLLECEESKGKTIPEPLPAPEQPQKLNFDVPNRT